MDFEQYFLVLFTNHTFKYFKLVFINFRVISLKNKDEQKVGFYW